MKRRSAIKSIAILTAGAALFPSCSDGLTVALSEGEKLGFTPHQQVWLETISEALLPKGDKSFTTIESFPAFASKMINYSAEAKDISTFVNGYNLCTEEIKNIYESEAKELSPEQIVEFFSTQLEITDEKEASELAASSDPILVEQTLAKTAFCKQIRGLAIEHLVTSKEYQEDYLEFKMVPDTYQACTTT